MNKINQFLYFGYTLDDSFNFPWEPDTLNNFYDFNYLQKLSYNELIKTGCDVFKKAFEDLSQNIKSKNILPLSGGLDSRLILGHLLDNFNTSEIEIVSYGLPGSFDFEIPQKISKSFGINHSLINLSPSAFKWDYEDLCLFSKKKKANFLLFDSYINNFIFRKFGTKYIYWSGFFGDPLTGSHYIENKKSWNDSVSVFIQKNNLLNINFYNKNNIKSDIRNVLPQKPLLSPDILSFYEQLDFSIRQNIFIKKIVLDSDYNQLSPFLHPLLINYFLNVPRVYRVGQVLYLDILKKMYPKLFSFPIKNRYGCNLFDSNLSFLFRKNLIKFKKISNIVLGADFFEDAMLNYSNFNRDLRGNNNFKGLIFQSLKNLKKEIWLSSFLDC